MLERLHRLLSGGGGLLRAEAQLASITLRRAVIAAAAVALAMALAGLALLVLAVAGVAMLAAEIGWAASAAIIAGAVLVLSLGVILWAKLSLPKSAGVSPDAAERDAERCKRQMREAVTPDQPEPGHPGAPGAHADETYDWKDAAREFVTRHPVEVASGAFAVLALVGPFRALRMVGRGVAVAGLLGTLAAHAKDLHQVSGNGKAWSRPRSPGPVGVPPAPGPATGGM